MAILGIMHIHVDSKVMEVIEHHMPISHSPCRRRSKGPLPSGFGLRFGLNKRARALKTCGDKGYEKLACDAI